MKNPKSVALIAFSVLHLASGPILAQHLNSTSTKESQRQLKLSSGQAHKSSGQGSLKLSDKSTSDRPSKMSTGSLKDAGKDSRSSSRENDSMKLGGADAGGGIAARQKNGQLQTLSEAGFIFTKSVEQAVEPVKKYPKYYSIEPQVKEELRQILAALPISKLYESDKRLYNKIVASEDRSVFVDARESMAAGVAEKIEKDYLNVLKLSSKKVDYKREDYPLVAYSDAKKTYILAPFDKLGEFSSAPSPSSRYSQFTGAQRQALMLIHEYMMRTTLAVSTKLLPVVQMDNLIYTYLTSNRTEADAIAYTKAMNAIHASVETTPSDRADYYAYRASGARNVGDEFKDRMDDFYDMNVIYKANLKKRQATLKALLEQNGQVVLTSDLILKPYDIMQGRAQLDMSLAQKFDSKLPFTKVFDGVSITAQNYTSYRNANTLMEILTQTFRYAANDFDSDNLPKYKNIASQLHAEFQNVCNANASILAKSDVPGDGLIYFSSVRSDFYVLFCGTNGTESIGYKIEISSY